MRIELQWKEIEEKNCAIKWGGWLDVEESSDEGVTTRLVVVFTFMKVVRD
jgi:hypothetical protein